MSNNIVKIALVHLPFCRARQLAEAINNVWKSLHGGDDTVVALTDMNAPMDSMFKHYITDNKKLSVALSSFVQWRETAIPDYELIFADKACKEIDLIWQTSGKPCLIHIAFNISHEETARMLQNSGFKLYQVLDSDVEKIISTRFPDIQSEDLETLKGYDLTYEPQSSTLEFEDRIHIEDEATLKIHALDIVRKLIKC